MKFHDGTPFNAAAVCYNFDRWYNMKGAAAQTQMIYYQDVFGGFAKNEAEGAGQALYKRCEAKDDGTAVVTLNQYKGAFPGAFALTVALDASPDRAEEVRRRQRRRRGRLLRLPARTPPSTRPAPARSSSAGYDKANNAITLVRNDDYWGEKAKVDKLDLQDHPGRERPQAGAAGRHHRRLRPARTRPTGTR